MWERVARDLERKLGNLHDEIRKGNAHIMSKLDDITAQLQATAKQIADATTADAAALADIRKALADALANGNTPTNEQLAALQGVEDSLAASATALQAIATPPAAPAPSSTPPVASGG